MDVVHFTRGATDPLKAFGAGGTFFLPVGQTEGNSHISCLHLEMGAIVRCRAGDILVYQRGFPAYSNNPAWTSCRRAGGLIRIWRVANPSPYGAYVFHATCDEHVITYYRDRVATYESTQRFVIAVACIMILVSLAGLIRLLFRNHAARQLTPKAE
jgi:hypothetical protein